MGTVRVRRQPGGSGAGESLVRRKRGVHDRLSFSHDAGQVLFAKINPPIADPSAISMPR